MKGVTFPVRSVVRIKDDQCPPSLIGEKGIVIDVDELRYKRLVRFFSRTERERHLWVIVGALESADDR